MSSGLALRGQVVDTWDVKISAWDVKVSTWGDIWRRGWLRSIQGSQRQLAA